MVLKPFIMAWLKGRLSEAKFEYLVCSSHYAVLGCIIYGHILVVIYANKYFNIVLIQKNLVIS